jgi:hypothetical protein
MAQVLPSGSVNPKNVLPSRSPNEVGALASTPREISLVERDGTVGVADGQDDDLQGPVHEVLL